MTANNRPQVQILYPPLVTKYSDTQIFKAQELRKKAGYSFAQLQKITGIPATTIRNWCQKDNSKTRWATLLATNDRKRENIKSSEKQLFDAFASIDQSQAKIYVSLLYWCEGYKYPSNNKMGFTNSDPQLVKLFLALLRKSFSLNESKFRVHLQLHTSHDIKKTTTFWSNLLQLPETQFIKPTITEVKGGKHRKTYYGTCTLRYPDYKVQLRLIGIYEMFVSRFGGVA